jgi:hypothetical protein
MAVKNIVLKSTKAPNIPIGPVDYDQRYIDQLTNALRLYFTEIDNFTQAIAVPLSGTTANRPVQNTNIPLSIGQTYFDTTLNRPIFWTGTQWIKADGTVV